MQEIEQLNAKIEALQKDLDEKTSYIQDVVSLCDDRLKQIQDRDKLLAHLESAIAEKQKEFNKIRGSKSWRYTAPIRRFGGGFKSRLRSSTPCRLAALSGLKPIESEKWLAIDNDPQFKVFPAHKYLLKRDKLTLSFILQSDKEVNQVEVYFDVGAGYSQNMALSFEVSNGPNELALSVPKGCKSVRLDPLNSPGEFSISNVFFKKHLSRHVINPLNSEAVEYNEAYGRTLIPFSPIFDMVTLGEAGKWLATGNDPHVKLEAALEAGWYMVDLKLVLGSSYRTQSKFYIDYGDGYSEDESEVLGAQNGKLCKRVIYFKKKPKAIRFDPLDTEEWFKIEHLQFSKLFGFYASKLINKKLEAKRLNTSGALSERYSRYRRIFFEEKGEASYQEWMDRVEKPYFENVEFIQSEIAALNYKPLISVVMPTYNTDSELLRKCIDSVLNQYYTNIEVCIADDCSPNESVREILSEYANRDKRVKTVFRKENGHISKATNSALAVATGEFIALLDHDDEIPPYALYMFAKELNENPSLNIIYSDEDKIDEAGNRFEPHFKCDWNPDLLYSQNYISHLGVYRKSVIDAIGGFRAGVEGSQDYDLLLRAVKHVNEQGIAHIPHVLYHWRAIEGSTALDSGQKDYTTKAGIKALEYYFKDIAGVKVSGGIIPNTYKVQWPLENEPLVSLIIPTRNGYEITKQAIDSILDKTTYTNYEILLVDNGSDCPKALSYFEELGGNPKVTVLKYPHEFNYSAINNFAVEHSNGEIIGLINNDVEVISPEWLKEMVVHVLRKEIGCVGAKLYYPNNTVQHAGIVMGMGGIAGHGHKHYDRESPGYFARLAVVQNYLGVTAAALVVRREVFEEVCGLNETDLKVAFNDVDFCLKVHEKGYRNLWTPYAELYHHESISRGEDVDPVKRARFLREVQYMENTWPKVIKYDPYYSIHLSKSKDDFSLVAN